MKSRIPLLSLGVVAFWSCKAAPGSSCDPGEARCLDERRELICEDGKFVEAPCKGKGGCSTLQERTRCDISGNQPGDPCSKVDEGVAACLGKDAMLACHARRYERMECRGPRGCEMVSSQASCDQSIAEPGDACGASSTKSACAADKARVLSCQGGKMAELYLCRGPAGCASEDGRLSCDQGVARVGDACDKQLHGHLACSEDRRALTICQSERFVASERCTLGTVCTVTGQSTACAKP